MRRKTSLKYDTSGFLDNLRVEGMNLDALNTYIVGFACEFSATYVQILQTNLLDSNKGQMQPRSQDSLSYPSLRIGERTWERGWGRGRAPALQRYVYLTDILCENRVGRSTGGGRGKGGSWWFLKG